MKQDYFGTAGNKYCLQIAPFQDAGLNKKTAKHEEQDCKQNQGFIFSTTPVFTFLLDFFQINLFIFSIHMNEQKVREN